MKQTMYAIMYQNSFTMIDNHLCINLFKKEAMSQREELLNKLNKIDKKIKFKKNEFKIVKLEVIKND